MPSRLWPNHLAYCHACILLDALALTVIWCRKELDRSPNDTDKRQQCTFIFTLRQNTLLYYALWRPNLRQITPACKIAKPGAMNLLIYLFLTSIINWWVYCEKSDESEMSSSEMRVPQVPLRWVKKWVEFLCQRWVKFLWDESSSSEMSKVFLRWVVPHSSSWVKFFWDESSRRKVKFLLRRVKFLWDESSSSEKSQVPEMSQIPLRLLHSSFRMLLRKKAVKNLPEQFLGYHHSHWDHNCLYSVYFFMLSSTPQNTCFAYRTFGW